MKNYRVLSVCDGISCGMESLKRANKIIDSYYASEIDEYAMSVSAYNHPNIIQIGDIKSITDEMLNDMTPIDLLIGGTPCQSLSSSNVWLKDGEGGLNGSGKSSLFWEYVRIFNVLKKKNPNIKFLLENVGSAKIEDRNIIDKELGVKGVKFNSDLLSAQNRNRIYWTNIDFELPKLRKEIFMQDILEDKVDDKYYLTQKMYDCIMSPATKGWQSGNMEINLKIARPLTATMHKMHRADTDNYISTEYQPIGKTNVRRLTPVECERLQTLPDNYTKYGLKNGKVVNISDTQRYMMNGNGWTVDVISYILSFLD
jgi:DNA-cytosine methyltransferase